MRIAIITESFPPDVNGVAHCVVRVAEHLARKGHHPLVIAPESGRSAADGQFPFPVERVPSVPLPGYPTFRLGLPTPKTRRAIAAHRTEVVHLASPVALGAWGTRVARAERPVSGAMTSGWCPLRTRCSATRTTQCATPFTSGGNDSVMIAILIIQTSPAGEGIQPRPRYTDLNGRATIGCDPRRTVLRRP